MEAGRRKLLALAFAAVLAVVPIFASQQAHADGLFQENLPPASLGDRQASLFVKINPPVLTTETQQDAFMQFRLFNVKDNSTLKFTTFLITVTKGTDPDADPLLRNVFHTESGLLTLRIQPQEGDVQILGTQEPYLNAWVADPGGTINIKGPILLEGGLYHFRIELMTVDNIRNLFNPDQAPVFDTYLSVGDVTTQDVQYQGQDYPTTLISYYDKVQDFNFDPTTLTYSWSMPFDWDVERLQSAANVFVHQEIRVPKSFAGVGDSMTFAASVNGKPIEQRMLAIDPFSIEDELTLHFLINKNDVLAMAKEIPQGTDTMTFAFAPSSGEEQTSGEIATDTGGVHVRLQWNPSQLGAGTESTLGLQFIDAFAGKPITDKVTYDIRVLDDQDNEVFAQSDQTAEGGQAQHTLTFPEDKTYRVEVTVKAIQKEGQAPDMTRNGIARGIVIVPEFPAGAVLAIAGALGAIVIAQRFIRRDR